MVYSERRRAYNQSYWPAYYPRNRERLLAYQRDYARKNRAALTAKIRRHRKKYQERYNAYWRDYYRKNRPVILERQRRYFFRNKEKRKASGRDYYWRVVKPRRAVRRLLAALPEVPRRIAELLRDHGALPLPVVRKELALGGLRLSPRTLEEIADFHEPEVWLRRGKLLVLALGLEIAA